MLNHYETVFILTPVLSDVQMKEAVEKFKTVLTDNGATITNEENWGLRKLAYPIQKKYMNPISTSNNAVFGLPFLYGKIESMPAEMQKEISLFADYLLSKNMRAASPKFGSLKGKIKLSADFDAPLSDFKK